MKRLCDFLIGVVTGLTLTAILLAAVYKSWSEDRFGFGRRHGYVEGAVDVIHFINEAANMPSSESKPIHFDVKDARLSVVRTSGFRTLRIEELR